MSRTKPIMAATILAVILVLDVISKQWALRALGNGERIDLLGGAIPLTLAFNRGAAFSLHVGDASRWVFIVLSIVALFVLAMLFRSTHSGDRVRILALCLVGAGAIGNLIDRLRWDQGVVDFIGPINLGFMYWPIFNVADMAITTGATLLLLSLWREERAARATRAADTGPHARTASDIESPN
jgi:signal peptidase II